MKIELDENKRRDAVASIQRYAGENLAEPLGDLAAGQMLQFFLEEIAPVIYNRGVRDASARVQGRLEDIEGELFVEEFGFWKSKSGVRRGR